MLPLAGRTETMWAVLHKCVWIFITGAAGASWAESTALLMTPFCYVRLLLFVPHTQICLL